MNNKIHQSYHQTFIESLCMQKTSTLFAVLALQLKTVAVRCNSGEGHHVQKACIFKSNHLGILFQLFMLFNGVLRRV